MNTIDIISCHEAGTLPGLFRQRVECTPDADAYTQYDAVHDRWLNYTWRQMAEEVELWRRALASVGLNPGDRVALQLKNSIEWVCFDQAALSLDLVVVPLYMQDNPENIAYVLGDSGSRLLLTGKAAQWQALAPHRAMFPKLETVICLESLQPNSSDLNIHMVKEWLQTSTAVAVEPELDTHALATIMYTSGTTGRPKGVMLSHHNILWNAEAISKAVPAYREDVFLSFLPLSHTLERTGGYYYPMMTGSRVAYARSIQQLAEDLCIVRPTGLISVPRIYERIYGCIEQQLQEQGILAQRLFSWAEVIGWRRFEAAQGRARSPGLLQQFMWLFLRRLVANKLQALLGGRLRVGINGGGPLDEKIARRFLGLGLNVLQGYGMTESSPVVSSNNLDANLPASVGHALPGVEIMLGANNELLVRSPSVMLGYWQRPDATQDAIDAEGWLHTEDVAEIRDGFIFIRGRIKEILVTSTGEKIAPADLEMALAQDPLFLQAMVLGEGKPYIAALVVLDREYWEQFARECDVDPGDRAALNTPAVTRSILKRMAERLSGFPSYAQVHAVHISLEPWTVDDGLITPTMKLKRARIQERLADVIQQLYAGHELPA